MKFPQAIEKLIEDFSQLPAVGPKTAERYVFYLLRQPQTSLKKMAENLLKLKSNITHCQTCFCLAESNPCSICRDKKRNNNQLCLVSNTQEMLSIESSGEYKGLYFILGGQLDSLKNIKPENLNIKPLLERLKKENIQEIIIALSPDLNGETTSLYLLKILKPFNLKISRLARGLPTGADLEYADPNTLAQALKYRNEIK